MLKTMKAHKGTNPMDVGHFGAYAVVQVAHPLTHLVQQPPWQCISSHSVGARAASTQARWLVRLEGIGAGQGGHDD